MPGDAGRITGFDVIVVGAPGRELTFVEVQTDAGLRGVGEGRMVSKTHTPLAAIAELGERDVPGAGRRAGPRRGGARIPGPEDRPVRGGPGHAGRGRAAPLRRHPGGGPGRG